MRFIEVIEKNVGKVAKKKMLPIQPGDVKSTVADIRKLRKLGWKPTTRIDVGAFLWARSGALRAHATQVNPDEPWWFGLTDEQLADVFPWEEWILARSLVGEPAEGELETDLFAGLRSSAKML